MRAARIAAAVACACLTAGCASDQWTRGDTVREAAWQALNVVDMTQTAQWADHPYIEEAQPLSRALVGSEPDAGDAAVLGITYGLSHYLISRALPPKWRRFWQYGTLAEKTYYVVNNERLLEKYDD